MRKTISIILGIIALVSTVATVILYSNRTPKETMTPFIAQYDEKYDGSTSTVYVSSYFTIEPAIASELDGKSYQFHVLFHEGSEPGDKGFVPIVFDSDDKALAEGFIALSDENRFRALENGLESPTDIPTVEFKGKFVKLSDYFHPQVLELARECLTENADSITLSFGNSYKIGHSYDNYQPGPLALFVSSEDPVTEKGNVLILVLAIVAGLSAIGFLFSFIPLLKKEA